MSEGFSNPIIGGDGGLVYPSIHSPNYVAGSAGWSVNKNGSAEFNSLTVRGALEIGQSSYWYSGAPGPGTLAFSVTEAAGTDPYGNATLSGFATYRSTTAMQVSFDLLTGNHKIALYTAASQAGPWTQQIHLDMTSTTFSFLVGLLQANAGAAITGGTTTDTLAVNGETTLTPQVMTGHPVIKQTDQSVITVTAITNTAITNAWPIGGGDAQNGTVYELEAGGYGAQGSTQETLRMQLSFMGVNIGSDVLPAATIPVSAQFEWTFRGVVSVVSNGAAGKARAHGEFKIWEVNGPATAVMIIGQHAAIPPAADSAVNTTANQTVSLGASWGSATGAPTITGAWSTLARSGA